MIRIRADNPSPLTGPGTNSFLIGRGGSGGGYALLDPGPDLPAHRAAILAAAEGRIEAILVSHAHLDHSGGAAALARATGAPILAYGTAEAGRSPLMARLAESGAVGGGEGLDHDLRPDRLLGDGERVEGSGWALTALHLPGHAAGHLCFLDEGAGVVFSGDLVFDWATTLISPPDGDLGAYFRSLARLEALAPAALLPAHGEAIAAPGARLAELAAHRRMRTGQILAALAQAPDSAEGLARRIYDIPPALLPAATRNVLAHLLALLDEGVVTAAGAPAPQVTFHLA